jgi:hypothetical protein
MTGGLIFRQRTTLSVYYVFGMTFVAVTIGQGALYVQRMAMTAPNHSPMLVVVLPDPCIK